VKKLIVLLTILMLAFSSCASIVSGTTQYIRISSSPTSANVVIYDRHNMIVWSSTTPALVNLRRGDGYFRGATYRVEISSEGFTGQTIHLTPSLNAGRYLAGNLLLGGVVGWLIIDPILGGMWTLHPGIIHTSLLQSLSLDDRGEIDGIYIVLKEQIPPEVLDTLELVRIN